MNITLPWCKEFQSANRIPREKKKQKIKAQTTEVAKKSFLTLLLKRTCTVGSHTTVFIAFSYCVGTIVGEFHLFFAIVFLLFLTENMASYQSSQPNPFVFI